MSRKPLLLLALVALCPSLATRADAAALRCYNNPELSLVPASIHSGQGKLLSAGYVDVTRAPYNADNSGSKDAAGAIQQAIDDAYKYSFTVHVPKGTYLIGKPIVARQYEDFGGCGKSNRKYINVVVGDTTGGTFPVLRAKDGAFAGKTMVTFMFEGSNGAPRHYGSIFRGFTLDMGNNPTATALSMPGAQLCSIEDIVIKGTFDIGIRNLPGSGGSTTGVTVVGGNVGIQQDQYRPTPSIHGVVLKNQKQCGIRLNGARGGLIVVGFEISGSGQAGVLIPSQDSSSHPSRNLVMADGTFELSGPAVKASENSMYLRNVFAKTATIVTNGPVGTLGGSAGAWTRVGEYAVSGKYGTPLMIDGKNCGSKTSHKTGVTQVASPPADLVAMHAWDPAKTPTYFNTKVLDIRDYGATPDKHSDDDAPAINKALKDSVTQQVPVFVPRGRFNVRQPVEVPLGASMIGASFGKSMIYADESWKPTSRTAVLRTEDGVGDVFLMDFATVIHEPAASKGLLAANNMYGFHGRSSNMLLRDVVPDRRPYYAGGKQQWAQTVAYFSGNAGGRIYNLALDYHESDNGTGEHYMFAVVGTTHPLALYQPNTESTANDPQVLIKNAKNVSWYALKFEAVNGNRELLHIVGSDNVLVLGGSGNYNITTTMVRVKSSQDVAVALLMRQGQGGQSLLTDGTVTVPPGKKITTYRTGKPLGFGELNPPDFPYPGAAGGGGGTDSGLTADSGGGVVGGDGGGPVPGQDGAGGGGSGESLDSGGPRGTEGCSVGGGTPGALPALLLLVSLLLCRRRSMHPVSRRTVPSRPSLYLLFLVPVPGCAEHPGRSPGDRATAPADGAGDRAPGQTDLALAADGPLVGGGGGDAASSSGVVYREHRWVAQGNGLRVGGKLDYGGHDLDLPGKVDLVDATRAEVTVEKVLIHDSTRGLSISVNGGAWITLPEAPKIPTPQWDYQHHIHPTVPVPLSQLKAGTNTFKLKVDPVGWWPQNFVHGVHLRVHYDAARKAHAEAVITSPQAGQTVGTTVKLTVQPVGPSKSAIQTVELFGNYLDVSWEGDNEYQRWHYHFHFGKLTHHVGTASTGPFSLDWDTTWLPDQPKPMRFKARITDQDGMVYETPEVGNVTLARSYSVEICRPYDVDKKWVTRKGVKGESFDVAGDLAQAKQMQLVWNSWCSKYMNGLFINGVKVMDKSSTTKGYATVFHRDTLSKLGPLKQGSNKLETGACCPGKHGMEVQYPGIQVLIRYAKVLPGLNRAP